jgi:hypothetical protein
MDATRPKFGFRARAGRGAAGARPVRDRRTGWCFWTRLDRFANMLPLGWPDVPSGSRASTRFRAGALMGCCVEPLEPRTLFTAVVGPTNVQTAYDALVEDGIRLKADVAADGKALAADDRAIAAAVKAVGKSAANTTLLRQVQLAAAKALMSLSGATSRYLTASNPVYVKLAVAAGDFEDTLNTGNGKRLAAAQARVQAVEGKQFTALVAAVANSGGTLGNAYTALASANPTASQLDADVATAENDQSAGSTTLDAQLTATQTNITTLLSLD